MKVSELFEETYDSYVQRLMKELKIKHLGAGYYAHVFQHPVYHNVAVKLFVTKNDPEYLKYAKWCLKNQDNPWVPKIISIESATVDKLESLDGDHTTKITIVFFQKLRPAKPREIMEGVQQFLRDVPDKLFLPQEVSKSYYKAKEYLHNNRGGFSSPREEIETFEDFDDEDWSIIAKYSKDPHVRTMAKKLRDIADDIHSANVMIRDDGSNQLVFTDPVAS